MLGFAGIRAIETSAAGVTVKPIDPDTAPLAAVIVTDPGLTAVASPWDADALLIDATVGSEVVHATEAVRSCTELSVYTPVAMN